jgi:hypothetical protein
LQHSNSKVVIGMLHTSRIPQLVVLYLNHFRHLVLTKLRNKL